MPEAAADDISALCLSCGLCCDGTLFDHAHVTVEETERLNALGFDIEEIGGRPSFRQPCAQLCGLACRVYRERPQACSLYRCTTLSAFEQGAIDRVEAERRIAITRRAAADLQVAQTSPDDPHHRMAAGVLDLLLDRFFRKPHQRRLLETSEAL